MAIYSVNQNRQFYVVTEVVTTEPASEGQVKIGKTKDNKQLFFKHMGKGGLTRTDLIDVDQICYAKLTPKADMQRKLKKATVTLSADVNGGAPIAGQDYILRIQINNYLAPGDACVLIKSGAVHATKNMTADQFYTKMAESLTANFSREPQPLLTFEAVVGDSDSGSESGIVITEVGNQPWRRGILSQEAVNFEAIPTTVLSEGSEEVVWGEVAYADTTTVVGNGKQIADLEYFCLAERGDMFRNMGWPNNIDVQYMVDPAAEYDVVDVHYFYAGNGAQVHKSEKDITFVTTSPTASAAVKKAFTDLGVTFA